MALPVGLHARATQLLASHPSFGREGDRRALLLIASLDQGLITQIDMGGAPFSFVARLIDTLSEYGPLESGMDALEAFLESCKQVFGVEGRNEINALIEEWKAVREQPASHSRQVREYLRSLTDSWATLATPLLPIEFRLADVAVPLRVINSGQQSDESTVRKRPGDTASRDVISDPLELGDLLRRMGDTERWVLLGDPGSGKTTLVIREAARLAEAALANQSGTVPIFIPLSSFGQRMTGQASYSLYEFINEMGRELQLSDLGGEMLRAARRGRIVFFLDGADEVPEKHREEALRVIRSGSFPDAGNQIVVTSRHVGASRFIGYQRLQIAPLTIDQQRSLMLTICGEERTRLLLAEMSARPEVQEMARVPMMLSVLALVAREAEDFSGDYFRRHTDLFRVAVRILLEGRHRSRRSVADPDAAEQVLADVSVNLHMVSAQAQGDETFRDSQVEDAVKTAGRGRLSAWTGARAFIDDVAVVSNIIFPIDTLQTRYRYLHRTIREFLAALAISAMSPDDRGRLVDSVLRQQPWAEVLVLLGGLVPDVGQYLFLLLQGPPDLALRTLKEVNSLDPAMAMQILQLRPVHPRGRRQVFVELVRKLNSTSEIVDVLWAYLESARGDLPRGDLFFINETLQGLSSPLADELADGIFKHMPSVPENLFELPSPLQSLGPYWCAVPAGQCVIGAAEADPDRPPWVTIERRVDIPFYEIGRVPVTNVVYEMFDPSHRMLREFQHEVNPIELDHHPVVAVNWYEAAAFCMWVAREQPEVRLPSEFEWEKAASWNGDRKLRFPWGDDWVPSRLNTWESGPNRTTQVGNYPAGSSPVGALDMAGNVWEWCLDWFQEDVSDVSASQLPLVGDRRADRGGGWYHDVGRPCTFLRAADYPADRFSHCGFRVVRSDLRLSGGLDLAAQIGEVTLSAAEPEPGLAERARMAPRLLRVLGRAGRSK